MSLESDLIEKLTTLNHIAETLNRAVDVRGVLHDTLAHLVNLMGLETGWIFVKDADAQASWWGSGYVLAAHHNLPPALELDNPEAWQRGCDCQAMCNDACLTEAYNVMRCGRLQSVRGDRRGLEVHASTPLRSGDQSLGILNVAASDWSSFSPESLSLLTNTGSQIGVALERARLYDLLRERRVQEQTVLLDLSNQLLSRLDLDDLMSYLTDKVRQVLGVDACAILLPGKMPDSLDFRAASGWTTDPALAGRQVLVNGRNGPGRVIHTQKPFVERDTKASARKVWAPRWLQEEGFRGQAMVPLITEGRSVGALIVDTRQPRKLGENETRLLQLMANQAAIAIEKARLYQEEVKSQALEKELEVGQQIQLSLLPETPSAVPGWDFATYYSAAWQVGGDFYDIFELPGSPHRLGMVIADVMGKGVPAALFMALSRTTIRTTALNGRSPASTLIWANELIQKNSRSGLFLTAFYATLSTKSGQLAYACAGHNRPLWLKAESGVLQELTARGIIMAAFDKIDLEEREVAVAPGDLLVFYTDGVTEAMNAQRKPFGEERLESVVKANAGAPAQQVVDAVVHAVESHAGDTPQSDDLTLFVVKRSLADVD